MMESDLLQDGGPVHPISGSYRHRGITLRDSFAQAALTGLLGACTSVDKESRSSLVLDLYPATIAKLSYEIADAMLAAREKGA